MKLSTLGKKVYLLSLLLAIFSVLFMRLFVSCWLLIFAAVVLYNTNVYPAQGQPAPHLSASSAPLFLRLRHLPLGAFGASVAFETVPHRKLSAMPPGLCVIGPCRCCITSQHAGELAGNCMPAVVAHAYFLKVGHFAQFSQFLHVKGQNFPDVFYPYTSTYDPYER